MVRMYRVIFAIIIFMNFKLSAKYEPTGDQPKAIRTLTEAIIRHNPHQTLVGVTGSGKTFTVAKVIEAVQKPTLIISHNKTLASQLYQEFRDYFPDNAVSYFVSYYDYYQPEAYIPQSDTYIEKETDINPDIDKLRLSSTANLLSRPDSIVVATVSCIYNLGSPAQQEKHLLYLTPGQIIDRLTVVTRLVELQYQRTTTDLHRGSFRVSGSSVHLYPSYEDVIIHLDFDSKTLTTINLLDPLNYTPIKHESAHFRTLDNILTIYPAKHFITSPSDQQHIFKKIRQDLDERVSDFKSQGKIIHDRGNGIC